MKNIGTDFYTGLANRMAFNAAVESELASGQGFALLLADMDQMKLFNIRRGYEHGDELLLKVADALQAVDEVQLAARYGGDEFAALALVARGDIEKTAEAVWRAMIAATASFDAESLRQHTNENRVLLEAVAIRDGRDPGEWPWRYPLGVSLVAMWVPPNAKLTPDGVMSMLFQNLDEVRKSQRTGFLVAT